jgi:hypothetical protein
MMGLPTYCVCVLCDVLRSGPTPAGQDVYYEMQREKVKQMEKQLQRDEDRWIGIEPWMGDDRC